MTAAEIIRAHAANQGLNPNALAINIKKFLEQPQTKMVRDGDCMFLFMTKDDTVNFYIVNGGNSTGYIRALRAFAHLMDKLGFKKGAMRISDKEQSKKIAKLIGAKTVTYKKVGGTGDPYLMMMEF
jgi:hypothetical protein